jgi:hypothetical protein
LATPTFTPIASAQGDACAYCTAQTEPYEVTGNYKVCVEPGEFSAAQIRAMGAGAEYWAAPLRAKGHSVSFDIEEREETDPACNMTIVAEPLVNQGADAEALGTSNGQGAYIRVSPTRTTYGGEESWNELFGHEWGHIFGFKNVNDSNCEGKTLMYRATHMGNLPSPPPCSDTNALATKYSTNSQSGGGGEAQPADGEDNEECWDVYWVNYTYYQWSDGSWTQGPTTWTYLYTECSPLE